MKAEFPQHLLTPAQTPSSPLWLVDTPPEQLFIEGKPEALALLEKLPARGFAIVGTREPQARTLSLVRNWVSRLGKRDLIIVSGLARGIDAEAHAAALDSGLPTIAILGAGLDNGYPEENAFLRQRILENGGLIITEFPKRSRPERDHFLLRNRLIAAWTEATWVVEAGFRSGALNTARWAREHHRTVYVTPCFPGDPTLAGNQILLDRDDSVSLWALHGLATTWPELLEEKPERIRARERKERKAITGTPCDAPEELPLFKNLSDSQLLTRQVARQSALWGGATVDQLLSWALELEWPPGRFFNALQDSLATNQVRDQLGILVNR